MIKFSDFRGLTTLEDNKCVQEHSINNCIYVYKFSKLAVMFIHSPPDYAQRS